MTNDSPEYGLRVPPPEPSPFDDVVDLLTAVIIGIRQARYAESPETRAALLTDATGQAVQAAALLRVLRVGAQAQASPFGPVQAGLVTPGGAP